MKRKKNFLSRRKNGKEESGRGGVDGGGRGEGKEGAWEKKRKKLAKPINGINYYN